MAAINSLKYPKKSHRKQIILPEPSNELAEFFGIMIGDGGINNEWQANICLSSLVDKNYSEYVLNLFKSLFEIDGHIRKDTHKNALRLTFNSTSLVDFLVSLGLKRGDKIKQGLNIPEWIMANHEYRRHCVRGLVDTDGCLYIHRHKVAGREYKNIGFSFTSASPLLIRDVSTILIENGISPHISGRSIYLYKKGAVEKYLEFFGTSNERIASVYEDWVGESVN